MTVAALLAEAAQFGLELWAENGAVRFRPRSAMSSELAARLRANRDEVLCVLQVPTIGTEPIAGRAHEPVCWGNGPTRRLVGNGFESHLVAAVPDAILADPIVLCPQCRSRPVLAELRKLTGGLCYSCWEWEVRS